MTVDSVPVTGLGFGVDGSGVTVTLYSVGTVLEMGLVVTGIGCD